MDKAFLRHGEQRSESGTGEEGVMRCKVVLLLGVSLGAGHAAVAAETQRGDPAEGARLADRWCSNCHMIGLDTPTQADDAAPSFASVARQPGITAMSLRTSLQTPHSPMPDHGLSNAELDNIVAYILALEGR